MFNSFLKSIYMRLTNKLKNLNNLAHYADLIAIPLFIITLYYFYLIEHKTLIEWLITLFIASCVLCDIVFSYIFLSKN